jgi:hypothetical protein
MVKRNSQIFQIQIPMIITTLQYLDQVFTLFSILIMDIIQEFILIIIRIKMLSLLKIITLLDRLNGKESDKNFKNYYLRK